MTQRSSPIAGTPATLCAIVATLLACTKPRTELVVTVRSELTWGDSGELRALRVVVRHGNHLGSERVLRRASLGAGDGQWRLPMSFGLIPSDAEETEPLWIEVVGCATRDLGACGLADRTVVQRAVVSYRPEETLGLDLWLGERCRTSTCGPGERCIRATGACEPAGRANGELVPWRGVPAEDGGDVDATVRADAEVGVDVPLRPDAEVGVDAPPPDRAMCSGGQVLCGGACVSLGMCTSAGSGGCETVGMQVCSMGSVGCGAVARTSGACTAPVDGVCGAAGACACAPGLSACGGTCRSILTDAAHCGGCGRRCTSAQRCVNGVCTATAGPLVQQSCPDSTAPGCGMVQVTGGTFTMGEASVAVLAAPPQPNTTVGNFALDAYEVTVARFRRWVAAGRPLPSGPLLYRGGVMPFEGTVDTDAELGCNTAANYPRSDRENHPINCVNWATAQAFCAWDGGHLPTQAEWEFAARGRSGRIYPWGSAAPDDARICWRGSGMARSSSCPVGGLAPGAVSGIYDLAGNVWEWNADWHADYTTGGAGCWAGAATTNALCLTATMFRVIRGGSWFNVDAAVQRSATRNARPPGSRDAIIGFRCARDLP